MQALAETTESVQVAPAEETQPAPPAPAPPAAPYVAPFGLRVANATTSVRAETAYGLNSGTSSTVVQYLTASYALRPDLGVLVRGGWVDFIPQGADSSRAFTNVTVSGVWTARPIEAVRVAATGGFGLPVGQGGGDHPDAGEAAAIAAGALARSRLEGSSMFSPNDLVPFVSGDVAYVAGGLTVQAEATIYELLRVRGSEADPDGNKTSLTTGVHVGYQIVPLLSLGAELRDQSYLTTPAAVGSGKTSRSWVTVGGGPRLDFHLAKDIWFRPGLAYLQPLNDPSPTISASAYHIVQLDLPLTF